MYIILKSAVTYKKNTVPDFDGWEGDGSTAILFFEQVAGITRMSN